MACALADLFEGIECRGLKPQHGSILIGAIANDSRRVMPGTLFVALRGQTTDGLLFVTDAMARGAAAVLASVPPERVLGEAGGSVPWIQADNPRALLAVLAERLYGFPARSLRLHGVTGTNGKTTTAYMLAAILTRADRRVGFWTTNSVEGTRTPFRPHMTTPEAPELQHFLRQTVNRGAEDVIVEVSSHALELGRVDGLTFRTAVITNITPDHLDFHGSFDAYVRAKSLLFRHLAAGGGAVLNADDPVVANLAGLRAGPLLRFGFSEHADVRAQVVGLDQKSSHWRWFYRGRAIRDVHLPVPGSHNILNALAALAIAMHLGIDPRLASQALDAFSPAPRRMQTRHVGDYTLITDVAMNPGSYQAVMTTVQGFHRPLVVVNAIRGNRGTAVNRDIADVLAQWNRRLDFAPVVATLSERQLASMAVDYRVRPEELQAFVEQARAGGLDVDLYSELSDAIAAARDRLPRGGILLLLGTFGMDDGLELAERLIVSHE